MDKIIALICEEARRRPGKQLVPKLDQVLVEVNVLISDLIDQLIAAERGYEPFKSLQGGGVNDPGTKQR